MIYLNNTTGAVVVLHADGTLQGGPVHAGVIQAMGRGEDVLGWTNNRRDERFVASLLLQELERYISEAKALTGHSPRAENVLGRLAEFVERGTADVS